MWLTELYTEYSNRKSSWSGLQSTVEPTGDRNMLAAGVLQYCDYCQLRDTSRVTSLSKTMASNRKIHRTNWNYCIF